MSKLLVFGSGGQVGRAIENTLSNDAEITLAPRSVVDITNTDAVEACVAVAKPDYVINAAAFTNVDAAQISFDEAQAVNAAGAGNVAAVCEQRGIKLIHISTDHVFRGDSSVPYTEESDCFPVNIYGLTKLTGEDQVTFSAPSALIVRTSWVYSQWGSNFLSSILGQIAAGKPLYVVDDQFGTPTSAVCLARALWALRDKHGIVHFSNEGVASKYDVAVTIVEELRKAKVPNSDSAVVRPIRTIDGIAKRPRFTVLDKSLARRTIDYIEHWQTPLRQTIQTMYGVLDG